MQIRGVNQASRKDENLVARSKEQVWETLGARMGNLGTYCLLQINGQRKFFDPLDDSPPEGDGCEVFIGRIPRDMYEDELVPLFAAVGPIHELRLMMNFSGTNRGFAFVMYKQPTYAQRAIANLNNFEVRPGQHIGVIQSVNNRRLYVGRLMPSIADEGELEGRLQAATEGLVSVTVHVMNKFPDKFRRFYALAVYKSHRHAAMARRFLILHKNEVFPQGVTVDWACPGVGPCSSMGDDSDHEKENAYVNAEVTKSYSPRINPALLNVNVTPKRTSRWHATPSFQEDKAKKGLDCSRTEPNIRRSNFKYIENHLPMHDSMCRRQVPAIYSPSMCTLSPVPKLDCMLRVEPDYPVYTQAENTPLFGIGGLRGSNRFDTDRVLVCEKHTRALRRKLITQFRKE